MCKVPTPKKNFVSTNYALVGIDLDVSCDCKDDSRLKATAKGTQFHHTDSHNSEKLSMYYTSCGRCTKGRIQNRPEKCKYQYPFTPPWAQVWQSQGRARFSVQRLPLPRWHHASRYPSTVARHSASLLFFHFFFHFITSPLKSISSIAHFIGLKKLSS